MRHVGHESFVAHEAGEALEHVGHETREAREHVGHETRRGREHVRHKVREVRHLANSLFVIKKNFWKRPICFFTCNLVH